MSRIEREQHDKNYNRERKKMGIHTRLLVRSIKGYRTYYVWTHVYVTPKTVIKRIANACEWWDGTTGKQGACNEDGCRFALRVTINTCGAHTFGLLKRECFFCCCFFFFSALLFDTYAKLMRTQWYYERPMDDAERRINRTIRIKFS